MEPPPPRRRDRDQRELRRLMQSFMAKPSATAGAKLDRLLAAQVAKFRQLEQARTRARDRSAGR